jgi:hypothetical protein
MGQRRREKARDMNLLNSKGSRRRTSLQCPVSPRFCEKSLIHFFASSQQGGPLIEHSCVCEHCDYEICAADLRFSSHLLVGSPLISTRRAGVDRLAASRQGTETWLTEIVWTSGTLPQCPVSPRLCRMSPRHPFPSSQHGVPPTD